MGLDFGYTCGDIDQGIDDFKNSLESQLDDMLEESCPLFQGDPKRKYIEGYVESIYDDASAGFEAARTTNEDMRKEADKQIDDLVDTINDLEAQLTDASERVSELENEVESLELS